MTEYSAIDQPADASELEETEPESGSSFNDPDFAARYGVKPGMSRVRKITLGVVGLCLLGGVVGYIAWNQANPQIQATVISYTTNGDSVQVTFQVNKPASDNLECVLQVVDVQGNVIGSANVPVAPGRSQEDIQSTINTTSPPNSVSVADCVAG
jgi:hypothetical protein